MINPNSLSACALHAVHFCEANETSISGSVIRAFVEEHYKGSMLAHMLGIIRASSDAPITVSPQPGLSRDVIDHPGHASADADTLINLQGKRFFGAFDAVIGEVAIKHSSVFVPQPAETIVSECFTMPQYSTGSVRLSADMSTQHPPDDFSHMNNAYGTLVLRDVVVQISKISQFPAYA